MERLIMEFTVGDGYTYSAETTYPIVYCSKEEAVTDFELMLMETIQILSYLHQERDKLHKKDTSMLNKMRSISSDKRMSEKDKQKNSLAMSEQWKDFRENHVKPLDDKITALQTINFGGQQFELGDFIYTKEGTDELDYIMPNIMTLDDFYSTPEHNLSQTKKHKM